MGFGAFENCQNLRSISLPSTLENFNYKDYGDDFESRIRFIYIKAITPPKFGNMYFTFMIRIFVPEQALKAYESSSWSSDSREYKTKINTQRKSKLEQSVANQLIERSLRFVFLQGRANEMPPRSQTVQKFSYHLVTPVTGANFLLKGSFSAFCVDLHSCR